MPSITDETADLPDMLPVLDYHCAFANVAYDPRHKTAEQIVRAFFKAQGRDVNARHNRGEVRRLRLLAGEYLARRAAQ